MSKFVDDAAEFIAGAQPDHDCSRDRTCKVSPAYYLMMHERPDGETIIVTHGVHQMNAKQVMELMIQAVEQLFIDAADGQIPDFIAVMEARRRFRDALDEASLSEEGKSSIAEFLSRLMEGRGEDV